MGVLLFVTLYNKTYTPFSTQVLLSYLLWLISHSLRCQPTKKEGTTHWVSPRVFLVISWYLVDLRGNWKDHMSLSQRLKI